MAHTNFKFIKGKRIKKSLGIIDLINLVKRGIFMITLKKYFILVIILILVAMSTNCKTNEIINTSKKAENQKKHLLISNHKFSNIPDLKLPKDSINIKFEGNPLKLTLPIYNDKNRLYIPFSELIDSLDGKIVHSNDVINISINNKNIFINSKDEKYWVHDNPNVKFNLKKNIIKNDNVRYISLFDLVTMLDLKTNWNIENKKINLFWNREKIVPLVKNQSSYDPNSNYKGSNNKTIYVPTPLNYVDGKEDLNNMLGKINKLETNVLGSFFYHPSIEFQFMKNDKKDEEYLVYKYDENSVLHQIIRTFNKDGYKFITIKDLK